MKVLVTTASRHGATSEIGRAIATVLRAHGLEVDVQPLTRAADLGAYEAIIIGSAVYRKRWLPAANAFIRTHWEELDDRPVFLFSSGPLGDLGDRPIEPLDVASADILTRAVDHQVFGGRLLPGSLTVREKLGIRPGRRPAGDYRPWDDIVDWARAIAGYLLGLERLDPVPKWPPISSRAA